MERRLRLLETMFGIRNLRDKKPVAPPIDINAIPQDEEIVLFEPVARPTYESVVPTNHPLPNPFIAGWQSNDIRRQAENELGV